MSDSFWKNEERKANVRDAEAKGEVADSMDVRAELVRRVNAGEITLAEAQAELAKIKREAKRNNKVTRAQAFNGHRADTIAPEAREEA